MGQRGLKAWVVRRNVVKKEMGWKRVHGENVIEGMLRGCVEKVCCKGVSRSYVVRVCREVML